MDIKINNAVYTVDKVSRPAILMEESDGVNTDYQWQPFFVYGKLPNDIEQTGTIEYAQDNASTVVHYNGYNLEGDGRYRFTVKYCDIRYE